VSQPEYWILLELHEKQRGAGRRSKVEFSIFAMTGILILWWIYEETNQVEGKKQHVLSKLF
jgi:hypothetical protein